MKKDEIRDLVAEYTKYRVIGTDVATYNTGKKTITLPTMYGGELPQSQAIKIIRDFLKTR